jgi:hypothetical protein
MWRRVLEPMNMFRVFELKMIRRGQKGMVQKWLVVRLWNVDSLKKQKWKDKVCIDARVSL